MKRNLVWVPLLLLFGIFLVAKLTSFRETQKELAVRGAELTPYMNEKLMENLDFYLTHQAPAILPTPLAPKPIDPSQTRDYITRWHALPQEKKDLLSKNHRRFEELSAEEKKQVMERFEAFQALPNVGKKRLNISRQTKEDGYRLE